MVVAYVKCFISCGKNALKRLTADEPMKYVDVMQWHDYLPHIAIKRKTRQFVDYTLLIDLLQVHMIYTLCEKRLSVSVLFVLHFLLFNFYCR